MKNKFVLPDDGPNVESFGFAAHYKFPMRTKSTLNEPERQLIFDSQLPVPIYSVNYKMPIIDHVQEQIERKKQYTNQREINITKLHQEYKRNLIGKDKEITSFHVKNYIENSFRDPASYVEGIDWNFNRGTLGIFEKDFHIFLATPNSKKSVRIIKVFDKTLLGSEQLIRNDDRFINQLMVNDKFIGMRHKKSIRVANLTKLEEIGDKDVIEASDNYEYKSVQELFTSAIFNDQLVVVDSNHSLVKYDLTTKHANFTFQLNQNNSKTCVLPYSVSALNETKLRMKITYTNCMEFGLIDCRIKKNDKLQSFSFENHFAMRCEKILNHSLSNINDNLAYILTDHMLYAIDFRHMKQPLVRWAHQIKEPPMMITNSLLGGTEVICLSSNEVSDLKIFHFNGNSFNHLPFSPLSIQHSYNKQCEEGNFLLSNIRERTQISTTGIAFKPKFSRKKLKLYTQNVAGDIFETVLNCKQSVPSEERTYSYFKEWDEIIENFKNPNEFLTEPEKLERQDLIVDDIARMNGIVKIFTCENLESKFSVEEENNFHTEKLPEWKISIDKARGYKDLLAKEIMNIWDDIEIEDVKPQLFAEALDATERTREDSSERVTRWLKASNNESVIIEEISFSENIDLPDFNSTAINSSNITKSIKSKPKKPRIAGF